MLTFDDWCPSSGALAALLLPRIAILDPALKAVVGTVAWGELVFGRTAEGRPYLVSMVGRFHHAPRSKLT